MSIQMEEIFGTSYVGRGWILYDPFRCTIILVFTIPEALQTPYFWDLYHIGMASH